MTLYLKQQEIYMDGREEGMIEGRAEGKAEGIAALIEISQEWRKTLEETRKVIMEKFSLNAAEAEGYMKKYWK